jgi:hypothetical protein
LSFSANNLTIFAKATFGGCCRVEVCDLSANLRNARQKQTFRSAIAMSALPLKADIKSARRNFWQVPEADNRARNLREHAI